MSRQKNVNTDSLCPITSDPKKRIVADAMTAEFQDRLPKGLGQPALHAFGHAGYTDLDDFTRITEKDLGKLHGVGPKAIRILREALKEQGKSFLPQR